MKFRRLSLLLLPLAALIAGVAVIGPEALAEYRDNTILNQIQTQDVETETEGYRYSLSGNEKLFILSKCLNNQILPESEQNAMTKEDNVNLGYQELTGTYALVVNRKDSAGQEIAESQGIELCGRAVEELKGLGMIPDAVKSVSEKAYTAVLYSAIDVPEPRNNVLVWKISLDTGIQTADRTNRLLDAYIDADTGKVYEFYVRTNLSSWEDVNPDEIIAVWAEYMGLDEPREYEGTNPLSETTPYFKKYVFTGMEDENTVVTVGFYEGINELFLKISR
ncbi:MAG: hypothetical protein NC123_10460 [Butyrivibrio sp.]|nr:hypothetical protein [Acetatifactor muris]MCM1559950.1 hypothetical protein [Butyrivibrio sp.]